MGWAPLPFLKFQTFGSCDKLLLDNFLSSNSKIVLNLFRAFGYWTESEQSQ